MIRPGIRRLFRLPFRDRGLEDHDLDEEIRLHLELRVEDLVASGLAPQEARAEAMRRFGPPGPARMALRRAARRRELRLRVRQKVDGARQDLRYATRSLARTPGMSAAIVLSLALGIGLCTSMYSIVRGVILDPVPFPEADRLLSVELSTQGGSSTPLYQDLMTWEREVGPVVDLAGFALGPRRIRYDRGTVETFSVRVTEDFFRVLRPQTHLGRALLPSDASVTSEPAAVISHRLWRSLLAADSAAIGRPIQLGQRTYSLVGVLEPGYEFPAPVDVWTPLLPDPAEVGTLHVTPIGRLTPGTTGRHAGLAIEAVHQAIVADRHAADGTTTAVILPLAGRQNDGARIASILLAISVGSILLIGIANAAGLIFTRALTRDHEIAIRASLGASRGRVMALLFAEALVVSVAAAGTGLVIAHAALEGFRRVMPESVTRQILGWEQLGLDGNVVGFALLLALIAGLGCGLSPAVGAARTNMALVLRRSSAGATSGVRGRRLLRTLVTGEVALSVLLLLCAGLLSRSLLELVAHDPGFRTDAVATIRWSVQDDRDPSLGRTLQLQQALLDRASGVPGVTTVALASDLPGTSAGFGATRTYEIQGADSPRPRGRAAWRAVSSGYFDGLGIPLHLGRAFANADGPDAPRVAVVSAALARGVGQNAENILGRQLLVGDDLRTIVGVTGDIHAYGASTGPEPMVYVPQRQSATVDGYLIARYNETDGNVSARLREGLGDTDPSVALGELRLLREVVDEQTADQRIIASLVGVYATTALVITLISLYAIVAHMVVRHRQEHGIRAALGASPREIVRSAMRRALVSAVLGTIVGTVLALLLARLISTLLYGITPLEPSVFGVLPLVLLVVFAVAVYLPARAAAKVDPMASLRM